jgi:hypothetical protein
MEILALFLLRGAGRHVEREGERTMSTRTDELLQQGDAIAELRPWREAGWIFKNGETLVIERQGDRTRTRSARISPVRDE